jgi:hypothetical protein
MRLLTVLAMAGGGVLAGIGFTGSYSALAQLAANHGFGWFSHVFPIGVDAGIVVLLALDLHLIRKGTPWPVVRLVAHLLTVATIVFNASVAGPISADPVGSAMHGVLPVLFITAVEAGRRLVIRAADIDAGREAAGVPLHRWLLAPVASMRMYRRMRLWAISSYDQAVALERERVVYRVLLDRQYGDAGKAPSDARLPLTMARYGLTVDEALALPQEAEEAAQLRTERALALELEAQTRAEQRAAEAEIARLRAQGGIQAARHAVNAETGVAEAQARAARAEAEVVADVQVRTAAAGARAEESADTADALRRAAEADRAAAETRRATAETEEAAAEAEQRTAEARRAAAEADHATAAAEAATETARADAETARLRAVEARRVAAETELRAIEAEDAAQLKPTERAARKVARMILADAGGNPEQIELTAIADALGVSVTTASERRKEAVELLSTGYRPTARLAIEKGTAR